MSRIVRVEVGRYDYDFAGEFKFFKPGPDGRVHRPSILVRLTDEDGVQGWGQAVPVPSWTYETAETVETTLTHYLASAILGIDPVDMELVHQRLDLAIRPAFSTGQPLCKAAIDLACYDLAGKRSGQTISQMLGGPQQQAITLSWTINSMDMAQVEAQLEAGKARGYRNFNIKVGPPQAQAYDLELACKVCSFAPDGFLWADANTGYSLETALDMLPRLADNGVQVIESPLPPNQIRGYQTLKRQGALPIFMDEGLVSPVEVVEFNALEMMDGITLKPARNAGLWYSQQIVALARQHGLMLLGSGLTDPDLSLAAALHLYAWDGLTQPCALNGPQYLVESLCDEDFKPQGDIFHLPTRPGLGLKMDECAESMLRVAAEV